MEGYPVQKGTPVIIPPQPSPAVPKKQTTRHFASADDQLATAKRTSRRLTLALIIVSMLLVLATAALVYIFLYGVPDSLIT